MWNSAGIDDRSGDEEDLALIAEFQEGREQGFNRLVRKYQDTMVSLCVRLSGNLQEGEDAAQEVFVRVFRNLNGFRGDARFSTWLYRIALNVCENQRQSWWRRLFRSAVRLEGKSGGGDDDGRPFELPDTGPSPAELLEKKQRAAAVHAALARLPAAQRRLIVLADIDEKRYDEIAEILGVALGTVKSRLARAREAMKKELQGCAHEP